MLRISTVDNIQKGNQSIVLQETIETEKIYRDNLWILQDVFTNNPSEDALLDNISNQIARFYIISNQLYSIAQSINFNLTQEKDKLIKDSLQLLNNFSQALQIYIPLYNEYTRACVQNNRRFDPINSLLQKLSGNNLDLNSILFSPIKHTFCYKLVLNEVNANSQNLSYEHQAQVDELLSSLAELIRKTTQNQTLFKPEPYKLNKLTGNLIWNRNALNLNSNSSSKVEISNLVEEFTMA